MKAQTVRLADIAIIGPLMVWAGWKLSKAYPMRGQFLAVSGAATIFYNGYNYLRIERGNVIPGGYAQDVDPDRFDPKQLRAGTLVEMEHTTAPVIAREIAMDHLMEDPRYYEKLKRAGL